ncbi:MAG TPA: glycine/sarcosine/betaine reductase component B subunit [Candidatus Acidoferrales bacterium]|nr:glycine/sarcosine/betaine reductase component B subunit [Candidatus Acidoferrales bacterium]
MRLDLGLVYIKDVRFGARTWIDGDVLTVDRDELKALLSEEPLFESVELALAHPGESCRITRVLDVLEPRCKTDGPNFPGALDPFGLVGMGETRALKNVAVVESSESEARNRSLIDMSGPAAAYSPFGATHNVVLLPRPASGADRDEFRLAVKRAGLKAAAYLGASGKARAPHETQVRDLSLAASSHGLDDLPRVAYIFPIHSHQHPTHQREPVFYGSNVQGMMPTLAHPNEILDGALVFSYSAFTYFAQNHPVIHELYQRHRRDLWFAGVVLTTAPVTFVEKERNACLAARLAREALGADGIIATKIGGGAVDTDLMMIYEASERMGMKAALIIMERYPDTGITFVPPNVDGLVSPGLTREAITLPAVERVIGADRIALDNQNPDNTSPDVPRIPARGELRVWLGDIAGAISQVGASRLATYVS